MDDYKRGTHAKYSLKVHLIFVTKYRKQLFWGKVKDDVKQFVFDAASKIGCEIIQMETDVDHIHILLGYVPQLCVSDIVRELK